MGKIFGEDHFLDTTMIKLVDDRNNMIDNMVLDSIDNTIKINIPLPNINIDKDKLKQWLILCSKLENIDKSDLISLAQQKKFEEVYSQLEMKTDECAICKIALENMSKYIAKKACEECGIENCKMCENGDYLFFMDNFYSEAKEAYEQQKLD